MPDNTQDPRAQQIKKMTGFTPENGFDPDSEDQDGFFSKIGARLKEFMNPARTAEAPGANLARVAQLRKKKMPLPDDTSDQQGEE